MTLPGFWKCITKTWRTHQKQDNTAPVATASAVQVREPLHRGAMQRWKRFELQLQPLRELLEQGGIEI